MPLLGCARHRARCARSRTHSDACQRAKPERARARTYQGARVQCISLGPHCTRRSPMTLTRATRAARP
eukprot:2384423-Pyramimonas_sp.AAC.1